MFVEVFIDSIIDSINELKFPTNKTMIYMQIKNII